ncbi:MAG: hypothetical protein H6625_02400 [Bdellovibrionaceae bacterium]|nr:hypothetical protein [Pseudobdellovibrionaceae bacterium]
MEQQYYTRDKWSLINDQLKTDLKIKDKELGLYVYKDLHSALMEVLWSFSRQYMIKKKVYYFKGLSPYFERCLGLLATLGYDVQELDIQQGQSDFKWLDNLDHTALGVLMARDIPFLGQVLEWDELQKKLTEKRVFQIELSHNYHYVYGLQSVSNPYHIRLYDFLGYGALSVFGKRAQHEAVFTSAMYWENFDVKKIINFLLSQEENQVKVLNFESQLPKDTWCLSGSIKRLFDRAVFSWRDVDATALKSLLIEKNKGLLDSDIQTPSLTTWGGIKAMDWLIPMGLDKDIIRGMIILDQKQLSSDFLVCLLDCLKQIRSLQNG